jgi:hypothetical protein
MAFEAEVEYPLVVVPWQIVTGPLIAAGVAGKGLTVIYIVSVVGQPKFNSE